MSREKDLKRVEDAVEALGNLIQGRKPATRRAALAGVDLPRSGQRLLWQIVELGPIRISDLARELGLADAAISRRVAALEAGGYVERESSRYDGRVSLIRSTAAGRRAARRLRRATDEIFQELMHEWNARDLADLSALMERLVVDLGAGPTRDARARRSDLRQG